MVREKVIFRIGGHPVMFWGNYGVVCPNLWTTNGSLYLVAEQVAAIRRPTPDDIFVFGAEGGRREKYTITDSTLPPETDFDDKDSLLRVLTLEWTRWARESPENLTAYGRIRQACHG